MQQQQGAIPVSLESPTGKTYALHKNASVLSDLSEVSDTGSPVRSVEERKIRHFVSELLFHAAQGKLTSCKRDAQMLESLGMVISDAECCDYDRRTPLHLASAEGSFRVTEWLLDEKRVNPNTVDRFKNSPLQDAIAGDHQMIIQLLMERGARLYKDGRWVSVKENELALRKGFLEDEFWEMEPDKVKLGKKIGEGEFGTVYEGKWCEAPVAVKVLKHSDNLAIGEFVTEMNMMVKLHHPHIVQFLGACTKQKPFFIVTELSRGGSLAELFQSSSQLPFWRLIELSMDCARGMAYLHSRGIKRGTVMHRDLKPANVMIFGNVYSSANTGTKKALFELGVLKITDFGLSKTLGGLPSESKKPVTSSNCNSSYHMTGETGSYRFMAPEVFRHETYNHKVDVYAFGMILYQLFEHKPPFVYLDAIQAARASALKDIRPPFKVLQPVTEDFRFLSKVRDLIVRCWDASPDVRPEFSDILPILQECHREALHTEKKKKKSKWWPFGGFKPSSTAATTSSSSASSDTNGTNGVGLRHSHTRIT